MAQFCIYITLEPYLRDWFVNLHGGEVPVKLLRNSVESNILEIYLTRQPKGVLPQLPSETDLAIIIPSFKHRDPMYFNYLPEHAKLALLQTIRHNFDICMWQDLHKFGYIGRRQDELIYGFMEKHHIAITEANWNAIAKRYQRKRNLYLANQRSEKAKQKKTPTITLNKRLFIRQLR